MIEDNIKIRRESITYRNKEKGTTDQAKKYFEELGCTNITSDRGRPGCSDTRVCARVIFKDYNVTLYLYYYKERIDHDHHDKEKIIDSGDCLVGYLAGNGMKNALIENIEFRHKFRPKKKDFQELIEIAEQTLILLLK